MRARDWESWISDLGLPDWQRTILTALHDYGGYLGDRTTNGGFIIGFESGMGYTAFGATDRLAGWAAFADDPSTGSRRRHPVQPGDRQLRAHLRPPLDWSAIRVVVPARAGDVLVRRSSRSQVSKPALARREMAEIPHCSSATAMTAARESIRVAGTRPTVAK